MSFFGLFKKPNPEYERAAIAAARWWGERLKKGNREIFELEVSAAVLNALDESGGKPVCIECDYDPCDLLCKALEKSGIECRGSMFSADGILPTKHRLIVYPDRLVPKEGYGNYTLEINIK